jgi:hypothetical protein
MPWDPPVGFTSEQLVTAAHLNGLRNSLVFLEEVAYVEFTATVNVTGTSFVDVVSSGAIEYENVPHVIEFRCFNAAAGSAGIFRLHLRDGSTDRGFFLDAAANETVRSLYQRFRVTPTAGSHTYKISGQNAASQTSLVRAGAGGAGVALPGFIRISRVPT